MPYLGRGLEKGNYLKLDDISSQFDGSKTTFNLTVGGSAHVPGSSYSLLVSLSGIVQEGEAAYTLDQNEITFAAAPQAVDDCFIISLGTPLGIGVPSNGTVNGTQLAKPLNYDNFFHLDHTNDRVGIGTSLPTQSLDVYDGNIAIRDQATASQFLGFYHNRNVLKASIDKTGNNLTFENVDSGIIDFKIGGDSRVSIGSTGKIFFAGDDNTYFYRPGADTLAFVTAGTERFCIGDDGQTTITAASGDTVLTLKRSDTNTTGLTGGINFAASDDHSVANIQAIGDGDNEGAHILFKTTTAAAGDIFNASTVERLRINSHGQIITGGNGGISFNNVGNSAFGSFFEINGTHTINHCGVLGISGITTTNNTRVGLIQFLNTSNTNSSSTGNAASRSLAHISVYADTSDDNAGNDSGGRMVFSTKAEADGTNELLFLTSDKTVGIQAIPAVGDMDSTATGGADLSDPKLYVYDGGTNGKYNLMIRCNSGSDADNTGSAIALNHSNDRGLLIEGGR